jgi:hypothetical protein
MNGIAGMLAEKANIRVNGLPRIAVDNSGGSRNGWIYVVTTEKNLAPAGSEPDIIMHRSTNAGVTWSAGVRVNQDSPNNGKIQYFPAVHVDDDGGVNVLYYDDRNTTSDSAAVYLSRSTDGGITWRDYSISDHNFKPAPIGGLLGAGYQGDNISMTSLGDTLWPVWMDNSTGIYQIWTCPISISALGTAVEPSESPSTFQLYQNFPNPFNPITTIRFSVPGERRTSVSLRVYDLLGREVETLVHEVLAPGSYQRVFDAANLSSGMYFYRLTTPTTTAVRTMQVVR